MLRHLVTLAVVVVVVGRTGQENFLIDFRPPAVDRAKAFRVKIFPRLECLRLNYRNRATLERFTYVGTYFEEKVIQLDNVSCFEATFLISDTGITTRVFL